MLLLGRSTTGSSPDLNVCENLGAILKDRVDEALANEPEGERLKDSVLLKRHCL